MHFVTGGAFNGKSKWVKEYYQLWDTPHVWISSYKDEFVGEKSSCEHEENIVVLEAPEIWFKQWLKRLNKEEVRAKWQKLLQIWVEWEQQDRNRKVVIIGNDMTKGIVPISLEERIWRDVTGWAYQDTVKQSERVDLIWYGINQQIK